MPGPNGVITVGSTYRHAYECNMECVEYAEAIAESEALIVDLECLSKEVPDAKRHAGNFEPAEASSVVPRNGNDVFQHNHVAPHGIGAAFLLRAQKILEIVDEREVEFL